MASAKTVAITVKDRAELERTIATYTAQGYAVARQTDSQAWLVREGEMRWWTVLLGMFVGGVSQNRKYVDVRVGATEQEAFHPVSEDGKWWWDGKHWAPTARTIPPGVPLSVDQSTWWTGREWHPIPGPMSGWHSTDYTPGRIPSLGDPAKRRISTTHFPLLFGLPAAVVLAGVGGLGVILSLPTLAIGCFLLAVVVLIRAITSPPEITIDASGFHAKARLRQFSVPWSAVRSIETDASGARVRFDTSGRAWPWHAGRSGQRFALLRARWFRLDGEYLAAALDEMSTAPEADAAH